MDRNIKEENTRCTDCQSENNVVVIPECIPLCEDCLKEIGGILVDVAEDLNRRMSR